MSIVVNKRFILAKDIIIWYTLIADIYKSKETEDSKLEHIETERKYIIKLPDFEVLKREAEYTSSDITQIYLASNSGITHRVRARIYPDKTVYTETKKVRISPISAVEDEREISAEEYETLAKNIKRGTNPVRKTRHTFVYSGQLFEIDVYPSWKCTAIMETELDDPKKQAKMPPFIRIVREVTGNKNYSNASMSRVFPTED